MQKIQLRAVTPADKENILIWRNDPLTRQMSINGEVISAESHEEWFKNFLESPASFGFIAEDNRGEKVGFIRFDELYKHTYEVNLNVAPQKRGLGFGKMMVAEGCSILMKQQGATQFFARIKVTNERSLKTFLSVGFKMVDDIKDMIVLRYANDRDR